MNDFDIKNKRILEIGCGIGLTSLLLNKRKGDISATDYHPEVEEYLKRNTLLNNDNEIPYQRLSWSNEKSIIGKFDLIIGSDILYEKEHIKLLSEFIEQHANEKCEVIIVDPGRKHHNKFTKEMIQLNYKHTQTKPLNIIGTEQAFNGFIIRYSR